MTSEIREAFERARARVEALQRDRRPATEIVEAHTADIDEIVTAEFERALAGRSTDGIAFVALGGYGRRELSPGSDLDLLILYRGWSIPEVTELNRSISYPLWDSRREVGDRIRDPRDVLRSLARIDEACSLLDARLLAGDRGLFADLEGSVLRRLDRGRASFFKDLVVASDERHHRFGHAGHLLEPNIRDSAGGLRDIHTLEWASRLLPGGDGLDALVAAGHLSAVDGEVVCEARSFLLRLRIELHLLTGRHVDQLYLAEQDDIARHLEAGEDTGRPPGDLLMQQLYLQARQVDAVVRSFWDRVLHEGRKRRRSSGGDAVGDGCILRDGRLEVVAATHPRDDAAGWLRAFRRSVRHDAPIGRASLNRLQEEIAESGEARWSDEAREVFVDILESGPAGVRALEAMDLSGLLTALIRDWVHVRGYPQRDLYHRYTVDRHLMAAVEELATSRDSDEREVRDAWSLVGDPDALFVAALLHDLGKGRGGDHSVLGARLAASAAERMGLAPAAIEDVEFLVREHLTLAETATRRDIGEQRTADEMAARVGDARRLAMLFLLTRADSLATGAEAWSSFRAALVRELYAKVCRHFEGASLADDASASRRLSDLAAELDLSRGEAAVLIGPMPDAWTSGLDVVSAARQLRLLREPLGSSEVRTEVHHGRDADEFIVVAADRPGLFSTVAGVLALRGIDVHDAEIYTRSDGIAVEVFRVIGAHGEVPADRWSRLRSDIASALAGELDLDVALAQKAAQARHRRSTPRATGHAQIVIDNDASRSHTVVEVHAGDRLGILRTITKVLTDSGCDLALAKVSTYGPRVVDVFYVRDLAGSKITDTGHVRRIEESLRSVLGGD